MTLMKTKSFLKKMTRTVMETSYSDNDDHDGDGDGDEDDDSDDDDDDEKAATIKLRHLMII